MIQEKLQKQPAENLKFNYNDANFSIKKEAILCCPNVTDDQAKAIAKIAIYDINKKNCKRQHANNFSVSSKDSGNIINLTYKLKECSIDVAFSQDPKKLEEDLCLVKVLLDQKDDIDDADITNKLNKFISNKHSEQTKNLENNCLNHVIPQKTLKQQISGKRAQFISL